jgi:L1 cell adhesion molecule like protein
MSDTPLIGIDLGTTYSCVGTWENGSVVIIPNDIGSRTTPSVVAFNDKERLIGQAAKDNITRNYENTVFDVKRLIGRRFYDETVQEDIKLWPFKVEKDSNSDRPVVVVSYLGQTKKFYAEEISAMVLMKMKDIASTYLKKDVKDAVITVPAYFNDSQRQATKDAGRIAGLNVLRIINEPTAAAVAYGLNNKDNNERYILVFDLGGGTFDVSILILNEEVFEVRATCGDTHLGGEDFDNRLVNYCAKKFKENTGIDISGNQKAKRRLKLECEKVKRNLSTAIEAHIEIENLANEESLSITVSRSDFENMCQDLFNKCIEPLKKSLSDAKITKDKISEVVLVGGSTRIPKICEIVENFFDGKSLNKNINADEAVAYGATYEAAVILDLEDEGLEKLVLLDVTPLSLGVEIEGERMSVIIPRNKPIPIKKTNNYVTTCDFQEEAQICVYQGEREFITDNVKLGEFTVKNIRKAPAGDVHFDITFEVDYNSILKVTAQEVGSDNKKDLIIKSDKGRLSDEEIERIVEDAKKYKEMDIKRTKAVEAKLELQKLCLNEKKNGNMNAERILKWIKEHPNASIEEINAKKNELYK